MSSSRFPVSYWCSPPLDACGETYFDEMEQLGVNFLPSPTFTGAEAEKPRALAFLDAAAARGMTVMLFDARLIYGGGLPVKDGALDEPAYEARVRACMEDYGRHPAVTAFYVGDEPNKAAYGIMCACVRVIRRLTGKEGYVNLLPYYPKFLSATGERDYEVYLDRFLADAGTKILSQDFYAQCLESGEIHEDYWYVLNCHLEAAKKAGAQPWHTVLGCKHSDRRVPSFADCRFQISMALAYGAKEISYFTLHTIRNAAAMETNFTDAAYDWWGDKTTVFDCVARANRELHLRFGDRIMGLAHRRVMHFPIVPYTYQKPLPRLMMDAFTPDEIVRAVSIGRGLAPQHLVLAEYRDEAAGEDYLFVANANPAASVSAFVTFENAREIRRYDMLGAEYAAASAPEAGPIRVGMWLSPGQAELHRIIR